MWRITRYCSWFFFDAAVVATSESPLLGLTLYVGLGIYALQVLYQVD